MVGFLFVSLDSLCPLTRSSGRSTLMFLPMRSALRLRRRFLLFSCLPSSLPFCCFLRMPADSSLMRRLSHNPLHEMLACFWRRCEPQSQAFCTRGPRPPGLRRPCPEVTVSPSSGAHFSLATFGIFSSSSAFGVLLFGHVRV